MGGDPLADEQARPYRRTRKRELIEALAPVDAWTPEATDLLRGAGDEATRHGQTVGCAHVLIACAPLPGSDLAPNDLRRTFGVPIPAPRPRVAHRLPVPDRAGPLVLGGGGDRIAEAVLARLTVPQPSVVYIGAGYPLRRGPGGWVDDWAACDQTVVDSGLYTRDDAQSDGVARTIANADVVLIGGRPPAALYDTMAGTRSFEALVAASDRGAVVVGSSGSAHVLGRAAITPYGDEGVEPVPTFGWLPDVVVSTHHRDTDEEMGNLRRMLWPEVAESVVLLVPERGAVWVAPGWRQFELLVPGTHGTPAKWWVAADVSPEPLSGTSTPPSPPRRAAAT